MGNIYRFLLIAAQITTWACLQSAHAGGLKSDCNAVDTLATIERSPSLIVGIAKDYNKKTCHFVVATPPPNGVNAAIDSWFTAKLPGDTVDPKIIAAVLKGVALSAAEGRAKEIGDILDKNAEFLSACATKLQKKISAADKSADGRIQCVVPKEGNYLEFRISATSGFTLSVHLPRTA